MFEFTNANDKHIKNALRPPRSFYKECMSKFPIYIWENNETMLHENDAADILRAICQNAHMRATPPKEGKIELIAEADGLLLVDIERLRAVNALGEMIIPSRRATSCAACV